jgi:hypothetical protein
MPPSGGAGRCWAKRQVRDRRVGQAARTTPPHPLTDSTPLPTHPPTHPCLCSNLRRVWGRGDGALLSPKFTGIAVFVAPVVAPYTRLLSVFKHSFGASEGSKGGVGVALGCYDVTLAFVNTHMASKKR